ncbi:MAG: adenosine deaminase family protein [Synechococcales cyanobacterium CRU_2_2]|nr:adenosine deaminase family protein [Synechococcales cyanobacterium CRU_2_2]
MPNLSAMPKAELHLHLEGAFRWPTLRRALFRHYGLALPVAPYWHAPGYRFQGFSDFLQLFRDYVDPWLCTPLGYQEIIRDVVEGLRIQNIRYAEIDFSVALIERTGHSLEQVLALLEEEAEAAQRRGIEVRFFAGINRHFGLGQALKWVTRLQRAPIIAGIDLHGDEVGWSAGLFQPAFELAIAQGKRVKVHAGEMTGPQSIRDAVALGILQIGHGTSSIQDPELMAMLRDRQVLLELCPTSNERLGCVASYKAHPLWELDRAGIVITINSDDSAFFGLNLTDEMTRLMAERQVTVDDLKRWTANAFRQADLGEQRRSQLLQELQAWTPTAEPNSTADLLKSTVEPGCHPRAEGHAWGHEWGLPQ